MTFPTPFAPAVAPALMSGAELSALRRLMMFSTAEAARIVAADANRPSGVEERTWNRWESGRVPVPDNVAERMVELSTWWDDQVQRLLNLVVRRFSETRLPVAMPWYSEMEDYPGRPDTWRPHCAAQAVVLQRSKAGQCPPVVLVAFDAVAYQRWRASMDSTAADATRDAWAASTATAGAGQEIG